MATSAVCRPGLRRACRSVNPGTCSTNVPALQSTWSQEPADRQPHHHRTPRDGQIRQMTPITAVHPGRHTPAPPAPRAARSWMRGDHHRSVDAVDAVDAVDHHRRQMREQHPATAPSHRSRAPRRSRPGVTKSATEPLTATIDSQLARACSGAVFRSLRRHRARVGPMLPVGMPSCWLICR